MLLRSRARRWAEKGEHALKPLYYNPQCQLCEAFYILDTRVTRRNSDPLLILESARRGCEGCTIIKNAVSRIWHIRLDQVKDLYFDLDVFPSNSSYGRVPSNRIMVWATDLEGYCETYPAIFFWKDSEVGSLQNELLISGNCKFPVIPSRRQVVPIGSLASEIEWITARMKECSDHKSCPQPEYSGRGPARLIDVETFNGRKTAPVARIVDTPDEFVKYTALSYCWGTSSQNHVLTNLNYGQYQKAIPQAALLRTFADAIEVTRLLGIRYIWIDAFCIVQDDADDWSNEAQKMCDVYQNSTLTISALGFANPDEGLFNRSIDKTLLKVKDTDLSFAVYAKAFDDCPSRWLIDTERIVTSRLPMMSRGWCYQERLLAVRTVHFTREELAWDCREDFCCQCRPTRRDIHLQIRDGSNAIATKRRHNQALKTRDMKTLAQRWREIVVDYTRLSLTVASDRLTAIRGVATEFGNTELGEYCYGSWEKTILTDSAWMKDIMSSVMLKHGIDYINKRLPGVPTWSWGSLDAAVTWQIAPTTHRNDPDFPQWNPLCTFIKFHFSRDAEEDTDSEEFNIWCSPTLCNQLVLQGQYIGGWLDIVRGLRPPTSHFRIEGETALDIYTRAFKNRVNNFEEDEYYYILRLFSLHDGSRVHLQYLVLRHVAGGIGADRGRVVEDKERSDAPVFKRVGLMRHSCTQMQFETVSERFEREGLTGLIVLQ